MSMLEASSLADIDSFPPLSRHSSSCMFCLSMCVHEQEAPTKAPTKLN